MAHLNPNVDLYLAQGCMRCALGATPDCKVHPWRPVLEALRSLLLESGLTEELKWKMPCYTFEGRNVVILSAFKANTSLNFLKGILLTDPASCLVPPGENAQSARVMRFTSLEEVAKKQTLIQAYLQEAIELEKADRKVTFKPASEHPIPAELQAVLDEDPVFRQAFETLTPGRRRGYLLHFSAPKQSKTRTDRIERSIPRIMEGKGMQD